MSIARAVDAAATRTVMIEKRMLRYSSIRLETIEVRKIFTRIFGIVGNDSKRMEMKT